MKIKKIFLSALFMQHCILFSPPKQNGEKKTSNATQNTKSKIEQAIQMLSQLSPSEKKPNANMSYLQQILLKKALIEAKVFIEKNQNNDQLRQALELMQNSNYQDYQTDNAELQQILSLIQKYNDIDYKKNDILQESLSFIKSNDLNYQRTFINQEIKNNLMEFLKRTHIIQLLLQIPKIIQLQAKQTTLERTETAISMQSLEFMTEASQTTTPTATPTPTPTPTPIKQLNSHIIRSELQITDDEAHYTSPREPIHGSDSQEHRYSETFNNGQSLSEPRTARPLNTNSNEQEKISSHAPFESLRIQSNSDKTSVETSFRSETPETEGNYLYEIINESYINTLKTDLQNTQEELRRAEIRQEEFQNFVKIQELYNKSKIEAFQTAHNEAMQTKIDEIEKANTELEAHKQAKVDLQTNLNSKTVELNSKITELQIQLNAKSAEIEKTDTKLEAKKQAKVDLQTNLNSKTVELNSKITELQTQLNAKSDEIEKANTELEAQKQAKADLQTNLKSKTVELNSKITELQTQLNAKSAEIEKANTKLEAQKQALQTIHEKAMQAKEALLNTQKEEFQKAINQLNERIIKLQQEQIIASKKNNTESDDTFQVYNSVNRRVGGGNFSLAESASEGRENLQNATTNNYSKKNKSNTQNLLIATGFTAFFVFLLYIYSYETAEIAIIPKI